MAVDGFMATVLATVTVDTSWSSILLIIAPLNAGSVQRLGRITNGAGVIFKLKRGGSGWQLSSIYTFTGGRDGASPQGRVAIAADGTLYGTTAMGGLRRCSGVGCGTVFHLRPGGPPTS